MSVDEETRDLYLIKEELRLFREEMKFLHDKLEPQKDKRDNLWVSVIPILVAVLPILCTAWFGMIQYKLQVQDQTRIASEQYIKDMQAKRQQFERELIMSMIKTNDTKTAANNLLFCADAKLLDLSPPQIQQLKNAVGEKQFYIPVLPVAGETKIGAISKYNLVRIAISFDKVIITDGLSIHYEARILDLETYEKKYPISKENSTPIWLELPPGKYSFWVANKEGNIGEKRKVTVTSEFPIIHIFLSTPN